VALLKHLDLRVFKQHHRFVTIRFFILIVAIVFLFLFFQLFKFCNQQCLCAATDVLGRYLQNLTHRARLYDRMPDPIFSFVAFNYFA